jgi:hypothetical protein
MRRGLCFSTVVLLAVLVVPFMAAAATPKVSLVHPGPPTVLPLPINGNVILWDQSDATLFGVASQEFPDQTDFSVFAADDFITTERWDISTIYVLGVSIAVGLNSATALNWAIYANDGGLPAGFPGGGAAPVWSISLPPTDPHVILSDANTNVRLNLSTPINLSPGTYWLIFYPTMSFSEVGQWFWSTSTTTNGAIAQVINPGGGFGVGTDWLSIQDFAPTSDHDLAFRLDGQISVIGIPTLNQWGVIFFVLFLTGVSLLLIRRKAIVR